METELNKETTENDSTIKSDEKNNAVPAGEPCEQPDKNKKDNAIKAEAKNSALPAEEPHEQLDKIKKDTTIKAEEMNNALPAEEPCEQPDKQKETEKEIDVLNFNEESQEKPKWWSDEITELRKAFVMSRRLLKKEKKKATKTTDHLMVDMTFAAYQHDKTVLRAAVYQARSRYDKLAGTNSNAKSKV